MTITISFEMGEYTKLVGEVRNAFNTGAYSYTFLFPCFWLSSFAIGRTKSVEWRKEQLKAVDRFEAD